MSDESLKEDTSNSFTILLKDIAIVITDFLLVQMSLLLVVVFTSAVL